MSHPLLDRRHWLQATAGSLAGTCLATRWAQAIDYTKPVPEAEKLTGYLNGSQVLVRWNNRVLTGYRAHPSLKYPYFSPLAGPVSGLSVTAESALPIRITVVFGSLAIRSMEATTGAMDRWKRDRSSQRGWN